MDYLILDSKTWAFQVQIILIYIEVFEHVGPGGYSDTDLCGFERGINHV